MQARDTIHHLKLELKVLEDEDIKSLWGVINQYKNELRPWLDWVDIVNSLEEYSSYMNRTKYEESIGIQKHFVVSVDHQAKGEIVFDDFDAQVRSCNLGYWLSPELQNKRIMTRACQEAITKAFQSLNVDKINIKFISSNKPSLALAKRLGFRLDGVLRKNILYHGIIEDEVVMSCFRDEWNFDQ